MKRFFAMFAVVAAVALSTASAFAAARTLTCTQSGLKFEGKPRLVTVTVGECGTTRCKMTVSVGNKTDNYSVKRSSVATGGQKYASKTGTLTIQAIKGGVRKASFVGKVKKASVSASKLRCSFND